MKTADKSRYWNETVEVRFEESFVQKVHGFQVVTKNRTTQLLCSVIRKKVHFAVQ